MADYALIDGYLDVLRSRVRWHRDVDNVLAEVRDHLYSTVERFEARGTETGLSQRMTLERFGDPDVMARALAATPQGGLAVPTESTKRAGALAIIGAFLLPIVVGAWWIGGAIEPWGRVERNLTAVFWIIGWIAVLSLAALIAIIVTALNRRHGSLGAVGITGVVCAGLGAVGTVFAWVFMGWGLLLTIGTLLIGVAMFNRGIAPRIPTMAFAGGFAVGAFTWAALRIADGTLHQWGELYGETWIANMIGLTVAALILAFGLFGTGRWLRGEEPAELHTPDVSPDVGEVGAGEVRG